MPSIARKWILRSTPPMTAGLAKINLGVAGRMRQRNKHLPPALSDTADVVLHNGDLARKAVLITQPLEYPLRCVTLLLRTILIALPGYGRYIPMNGSSFGRTGGRVRT